MQTNLPQVRVSSIVSDHQRGFGAVGDSTRGESTRYVDPEALSALRDLEEVFDVRCSLKLTQWVDRISFCRSGMNRKVTPCDEVHTSVPFEKSEKEVGF
jgi:hypothetical protein